MADELRTVPISRALNRPNLLMGAERELALTTALVAALLIFVTFSVIAIVTGLVLWALAIAALRAMAKADPVMSKVYQRHIKYRPYYAPRSRPTRES
jgi:type IV secretion system protein VirB3